MSDTALIQSLQQGIDELAHQADLTWGAGRLSLLVSDDTRARFIRQQRRYRAALEEAWNERQPIPKPVEDALRAAAGGMQRAWAAVDQEARARGHQPLKPQVWDVSLADGSVVAVVRTPEEALLVPVDGRHVSVYSLDEIANVIDALGTLKQAKSEFPGAVFVAPLRVWDGKKVGNSRADYAWVQHGDPIPFGDPP